MTTLEHIQEIEAALHKARNSERYAKGDYLVVHQDIEKLEKSLEFYRRKYESESRHGMTLNVGIMKRN